MRIVVAMDRRAMDTLGNAARAGGNRQDQQEERQRPHDNTEGTQGEGHVERTQKLMTPAFDSTCAD
jgi:hypothetical protein